MPPRRNNWVLCNQHSNCDRCKNALTCWKNKANKHAGNARNLKYVLMCLMDDRTTRADINTETQTLPVIEPNEKRGEMKWSKCGICYEKITLGGAHNTIVFPCGHTTCLTCYNNEAFRSNAKCHYCRQEITKAYRLWLETETEEEELE